MSVGTARIPLALLVDLLWTFAAVALFVQIFARGDGPAPSIVAVAVAVFGSFALSRALQNTDLDEATLRIAGVATTFLVFFLLARLEYAPNAWPWDFGWLAGLFTDTTETIRPNGYVFSGLVALAPFWLRGIIRGQSSIEFDEVLASASIGLFAVIIAAMAAPETREPVPWGAFALAYAVVTLVTLALYQSPEQEQSVAAFARRWASAIAAIAVVSVALALVATAIDPDAFGVRAPIGEPVTVVGRIIGTYVLGPILAVVLLPFRAAGWLLGLLLGGPADQPQQQQVMDSVRPEPQKDDSPLWFYVLLWTVAGFGLLALTAIVSAILWFAFQRFARAHKRDPRERRESVEPASSLAEDLGDLLGGLAKRFRRSPRARAALQIRRLYFDMLDAASTRGLERPPAATPLQFAPSLDAHFASDVPSSISRAFAASRYGDVAIDGEIVRDLEHRWHALEARPQGTIWSQRQQASSSGQERDRSP